MSWLFQKRFCLMSGLTFALSNVTSFYRTICPGLKNIHISRLAICNCIATETRIKKGFCFTQVLSDFFFTPYTMLFIVLLLCCMYLFCDAIILYICNVVMHLFFLYWWWWWWWIVFVVWLTDQRRLASFTFGTIVRDPHHRESPTRQQQDFSLRRTWGQALLNELVQ